MIRKTKKGWAVVAHSGKKMGTYTSKARALRRLRQIEYFKKLKRHGSSAS